MTNSNCWHSKNDCKAHQGINVETRKETKAIVTTGRVIPSPYFGSFTLFTFVKYFANFEIKYLPSVLCKGEKLSYGVRVGMKIDLEIYSLHIVKVVLLQVLFFLFYSD